MGWHDVNIHAVAFRAELFEFWLDVDYIFSWVHPQGEETHFRFWVAPATLVFTNVHSLRFDLESHDGDLSLQGIERSEPSPARNAEYLAKKTEWLWLLDCNEGEITFSSVGFSQFIRRPPVLLQAQQLTLEERVGFHLPQIMLPNHALQRTAACQRSLSLLDFSRPRLYVLENPSSGEN